MKKVKVMAVTMILVLSMAAGLEADTLNVLITEDTSMRAYDTPPWEAIPTWNYGDLTVYTNYHIVKLALMGENAETDEMRFIVKASDIVEQLIAAGIKNSDEIMSADLHVFRSGTSPAGTGGQFQPRTYRMTKDWVEGSSSNATEIGASCWDYAAYDTDPWTAPGAEGDYQVGGYPDPNGSTRDFMGGWKQMVISGSDEWIYMENISEATEAVKYWFDNPDENYGILAKATEPSDTGQKEVYYYSSEYSVSAKKPYIKVEFALGPQDCQEVWGAGLGMAADLDKDCNVDLGDLALMSQEWLMYVDPDSFGI